MGDSATGSESPEKPVGWALDKLSNFLIEPRLRQYQKWRFMYVSLDSVVAISEIAIEERRMRVLVVRRSRSNRHLCDKV
jgi:hypothetical protein